jgi:hypothetical protein
VNLFSDSNCATSVGAVPNNGGCVVIASSEVQVNSIAYTATATQMCNAGTSTPTTTPVGPRTICCQ